MKTNFHTHSIWCDGKDDPETIVRSALAKGFSTLGFSSHSTYPVANTCTVPPERLASYFAAIRELAAAYTGHIQLLCGVEADFIPDATDPDRTRYEAFAPDYIIGSVHYVIAADGERVPADHSPQLLREGLSAHFGGNAEAYVRAYFAQEREMVRRFDFDVVGHPDLIRKFNAKHPYFDEDAPWYRDELARTADVIAASGKLVEVNTGAISRGWLDDAYPSATFRGLLRERGVRFILSSDAHTAETIDCAFDRFSGAERYVIPPFASLEKNAETRSRSSRSSLTA